MTAKLVRPSSLRRPPIQPYFIAASWVLRLALGLYRAKLIGGGGLHFALTCSERLGHVGVDAWRRQRGLRRSEDDG